MSSKGSTTTLVEVSEHFLSALTLERSASGCEVREVVDFHADNTAGIGAWLEAIPADQARGGWLVRSGAQFAGLAASAAVAKTASPEQVVRELGSGRCDGFGAMQAAIVRGSDGAAWTGGADGRWLAFGLVKDEAAKARARIEAGGKFAASDMMSASLAQVWSTREVLQASGSAASVALWEFGLSSSALWIVDAKGVKAIEPVGVAFEQLTDAIMEVVGLKFRGAAGKLFFNERYDFKASAADIAGRLVKQFRPEAAALLRGGQGGAPEFHLSGLPARQQWLGAAVASSLGSKVWTPDLKAWLGELKVKTNTPLSASQVGLVGFAARPSGINHWSAVRLGDPFAARPQPVAEARPENIAVKAAPVAVEPAPAIVKVKPVVETPKPEVARAAPTPAPAPTPVKSGKRGGSLVAAATEKVAQNERSPAAEPAAAQVVAETGRARRSPMKWGWIGTAFAVLTVGVLGFLYFQKVEAERQTAQAEKAELEQRAAAAATARLEVERAMREETEARKRAEELARQQATEAEAARVAAEQQSRMRDEERERLLHARGSVVLRTQPAGATVTVGNLAPRTSPATIQDLRLGRYTARIELEGHDSAELEFEIRENQQTSPQVVTLRKRAGGLSLNTEPANVAFDIRPAGSRLFVSSAETMQGVTPARLDGLAPGEYVVTFLREGWPRASSNVQIEDRSTATARHRYEGGALRLISTPLGASVFVNDRRVGVTPCEVADLPPGPATVRFELEGMAPERVETNVEVGGPLEVAATLVPLDRVARLSELDVRPEPVQTVAPKLASSEAIAGSRVLISAIVDENGVPGDIRVEQTPDAESGRICAEAIAQWRFKPGMIGGRPVKTRVSIPFSIN